MPSMVRITKIYSLDAEQTRKPEHFREILTVCIRQLIYECGTN
jgi:hypothetical protein